MAAITVANCKVYQQHEGDIAVYYLITPSTADSADTIDITTLADSRTIVNLEGYDQTTGDNVTVTNSSYTLTLDAAGGTTDKTYTVKVELLR